MCARSFASASSILEPRCRHLFEPRLLTSSNSLTLLFEPRPRRLLLTHHLGGHRDCSPRQIYLEALLYGRLWLPYDILAWFLGWTADVRSLKGTIDVIGINHYYRSFVSLERAAATAEASAKPSPTDLFLKLPLGLLLRACSISGFEKSDMGWDLTPSSMERLLTSMWERYRIPLIVTESGIADGDEPDTRRSRYLAACLSVASRLRAKGVDLRGYLFWTLLDNFEWAEGFRPRFGLLRTDFETLERHGRPSNAIVRAAATGYAAPPGRSPESPRRRTRSPSKR